MSLFQRTPFHKPALIWQLFVGVFFLFYLSGFIFSTFIPSYSDEFFWKVQISRFFFDEGKLLGLSPMCESAFLLATPLSWYPTVLMSSIIYAGVHSLSQLKLFGLLGSLVLFFLWAWMVRLSLGLRWIYAFIFVAGFLSVGVLPFLLTFNRPEQSLLLFLSIGLWIPLILPQLQLSKTHPQLIRPFLCLAYCLLAACLCAAHPKSLFLLPLLLVAYWRCQGGKIGLGIAGIIMLVCAIQTTAIWSAKSYCPESAFLTQVVSDISLSPSLIKTAPLSFIFKGIHNLSLFPKYVNAIYFQDLFQSNWLPAISTIKELSPWVTIANFLCWGPLLLTLVLVMQAILRKPIASNIKQVCLIFLFFCAFFALTIQQTTKNFYEAGLFFPLLLLLSITTFTPDDGALKKRLISWVIPLCLITGLYSGIVRTDIFLSNWASLLAQNKIIISAELAASPNSAQGLQRFANEQCAINSTAKTLVLDQKSYPAFANHHFPIFENYVFGYFATGSDYHQVLKVHNTDGLITMCHVLPNDLLNKAKHQGTMCCISKENLLTPP